jgi:Protein tyrosine and serine/threonine kinase/Leucine rich repeat
MDTLTRLRSGELLGSTRLDLRCGLTEFPQEIFTLADTLEILDLSGNQLTDLPPDFSRLHRLKIFFGSSNPFRHLPAVLGDCASLEMVGFKACQIETIDPAAFPKQLRWLTLTDNQIRELPSSIGHCPRLEKLMLAGNQLKRLPIELGACQNLALIRLSANQFQEFPAWLFDLPKLAWLALAGNPCLPPCPQKDLAEIHWDDLEVGPLLGEGASGHIYQAVCKVGETPQVAVKLFKGAVTSDGLPEHEMAASLQAGQHPSLIGALARICHHPEGKLGLVMRLIEPEFINLAQPPSFQSCTRDVYLPERKFSPEAVLQMASDLASVAKHLHQQGIMHGDFYGHNVLWDSGKLALLGDLGGATFYPPELPLEHIEVRAYGHLIAELLERCDASAELEGLWEIQRRCTAERVKDRPSFAEICSGVL